MAQLKDTTINGHLEVKKNINLETNQVVKGNHPLVGKYTNMLQMNDNGNVLVGYGGYYNKNGDTFIYGNDIKHYVAAAGDSAYRPYRRAGDSMTFNVRTCGYVTNNGKTLIFTIPMTLPVLGSPIATASSNNGFVLRQEGYTHGSNGASSPVTYVKPTRYSVEVKLFTGFIVHAFFDDAPNAINNSPIGVYWDGTISLS